MIWIEMHPFLICWRCDHFGPIYRSRNTCVCLCVQVVEELWEEEFIERCVLELLEEEEQWEWFIPSRDLPTQPINQLQDQISLLVLDTDAHVDVDVVVSPLQPVSSLHPVHPAPLGINQSFPTKQSNMLQRIQGDITPINIFSAGQQ